MTEIWKQSVGPYEVSNRGRVRRGAHILKPSTMRAGHQQIGLTLDGKRVGWMVHRLVYQAFVGPLKEGLSVCHLDGDPANNTPANLLQASHRTNMQHKYAHGTQRIGEGHWNSIYTRDQIGRAMTMLEEAPRSASGQRKKGTYDTITEATGVKRHTLKMLLNGRRTVA